VLYEERALRLPIAGLTQITGLAEMLAGDPRAAERELRLGYDILVGAGARSFVGLQAALLAEAVLARGAIDEAVELGRISEEAPNYDVASLTIRLAVRARLQAVLGHGDAAVDLAREAEAAAAATDAPNLRADALIALSRSLVVAGRPDEAERAADAARVLYERKGNVVAARSVQVLPRQPLAR
jgi:ATP/maltotriose-dependent transcriptional regulator MalT